MASPNVAVVLKGCMRIRLCHAAMGGRVVIVFLLNLLVAYVMPKRKAGSLMAVSAGIAKGTSVSSVHDIVKTVQDSEMVRTTAVPLKHKLTSKQNK